VFIIWVVDGYFPSAKANASIEAIEEERRLMYVAATRAKEDLVLCYPSQEPPRTWAANDDGAMPYSRGLSSFIQSLPRGIIEYRSMGTPFRAGRVSSILKKAATPKEKETKPRGLRPGDRVRHPAFGQGVISKVLGEDKVEVLFRDFGRRLLHLGYTSLEKV
jgi:DNA helicase-2/ATP-dependent DNA helicase PcrA